MIDLYHEEFKNVLLVCHRHIHQPQNFWVAKLCVNIDVYEKNSI
jgi:hypothetical protein